MESIERAPQPLWAWILVGWILVGSIPTPAPQALEFHDRAARMGTDLGRLSPRELRAAEGLGDRRAVRILQARWRHPRAVGPFDPLDVPGVGPVTVAGLEGLLEARRAATSTASGAAPSGKNPADPLGGERGRRTLPESPP